MSDLTATTLYSHEGSTNTALAPATTAAQVQMNSESGTASTAEAEIVALRKKVNEVLAGGVSFKGALTKDNPLPTVGYKAGWQYTVKEAGTYAGQTCEAGDLVLCIKDYASGSAANSDWSVIQANIVGAVTGPASSVAEHVATFSGTSGKIIKDSGFTIGKSVPANAQFTDTTYAAATDAADGLLTAALHKKLVGIEEGADVTDAANVTAAGAFMKKADTADAITDGTDKVLMTAAERTKLAGIAEGAQKNVAAFRAVAAGGGRIDAAESAVLLLNAGSGITISIPSDGDGGLDGVTFSETYIDSCCVTSLDKVPANLRNGGLVIVKG